MGLTIGLGLFLMIFGTNSWVIQDLGNGYGHQQIDTKESNCAYLYSREPCQWPSKTLECTVLICPRDKLAKRFTDISVASKDKSEWWVKY